MRRRENEVSRAKERMGGKKVTHGPVHGRFTSLALLAQQLDMRPERRLADLLRHQKPIHLVPLVGRKLDLLPPLLHPRRVALKLLHELLEQRREAALTTRGSGLLRCATEGNNSGKGEFGKGDRGREGGVVLCEEERRLVHEGIGVDSSALVRRRALEVVVPVEGLERRRLGTLGQVGRVEELEEGGGEGDVDAGALDEAEEGANEVEAEGEVAGGGDEAVVDGNTG